MREHDHDKLVGALVGPEGPELGCDECFDELDRYVELELAGADAEARIPGMRAHLEHCPACHEDHASLRAYLEEGPGTSEAPPSAI